MGFDDEFSTIQPVGKISRKPGFWRTMQWNLFGLWAWSPIISFQVGLTAGYAALIYFGVAALYASPPSFENTSPDGWAWGWAIGLVVGAMIAVVGSISRNKKFEITETVGASLLTLTVGSYVGLLHWVAYAAGDADRVAGAAGFTALAVPIIVRTMWLWSQLLRK